MRFIFSKHAQYRSPDRKHAPGRSESESVEEYKRRRQPPPQSSTFQPFLTVIDYSTVKSLFIEIRSDNLVLAVFVFGGLVHSLIGWNKRVGLQLQVTR